MLAEEAMVQDPGLSALVVCGGGPIQRALPKASLVVAADGGLTEANRLGLAVDLLVGDMDSAAPDDVAAYVGAGGAVERHPVDKDATDLELALRAVSERGVAHVTVAGGSGGRLDHLLGNALTVASATWAHMQVDAIFGPALAHVVRGSRTMEGEPGELMTLFALGGPAHGVRTRGLRWELHGVALEPGSGLGISNEFIETRVTIEVGSGVVLALRPGVRA